MESGESSCTHDACEQRPSCGGSDEADCPADMYCKSAPEDACGNAGASGLCTPRTAACSAIQTIVCGCDGENYGDACDAARAGTSVLHEGFCGGCEYGGMTYLEGDEITSIDGCNACHCDGATGKVSCGTDACPEEHCGTHIACSRLFDFCDYDRDANCGDDGAMGQCTLRPEFETCDATDEPVCGCDDVTYTNACQAHAMLVAIRANGPCKYADGCDYQGKHYLVGAGFLANDHCNQCACLKDGTVDCTAAACQ